MSLSHAVFCFIRLKCHLNKKIRCCARLVHECPKIHNNGIATIQSLHDFRTEVAWALCDIRAISRSGCGDCSMTVQSLCGLSTVFHRFVVETPQRNRTMVQAAQRSYFSYFFLFFPRFLFFPIFGANLLYFPIFLKKADIQF